MITRDRYCRPNVTLANCSAILLRLEPPRNASVCTLIVWHDKLKWTRPLDPQKRIRDLRPGDEILFHGKRKRVMALEIYR